MSTETEDSLARLVGRQINALQALTTELDVLVAVADVAARDMAALWAEGAASRPVGALPTSLLNLRQAVENARGTARGAAAAPNERAQSLEGALRRLLAPAALLHQLDKIGYATPGRRGDGYNRAMNLLAPAIVEAEQALRPLP